MIWYLYHVLIFSHLKPNHTFVSEGTLWISSSHWIFPSFRLAASSDPARSPEQGDVCPLSIPNLPTLRSALAGVWRGGLLCHCLGHFHWRDEAHFLCPWRRNHTAYCSTWKLQCKLSHIMHLFLLTTFCLCSLSLDWCCFFHSLFLLITDCPQFNKWFQLHLLRRWPVTAFHCVLCQSDFLRVSFADPGATLCMLSG